MLRLAKLHFGAHFQAPGLPNQTAGTVDVYGLQILDVILEAGNTAEEDTAASALLLKHEFLDDVTLATLGEVLLEPTLTTLGNFLVRSNSHSSVVSASFAVAGFQLEGYAMTLSAFAWNIVRTYTLTPRRRYSFGSLYTQWFPTATILQLQTQQSSSAPLRKRPCPAKNFKSRIAPAATALQRNAPSICLQFDLVASLLHANLFLQAVCIPFLPLPASLVGSLRVLSVPVSGPDLGFFYIKI